jgi:hypothetical protein
MKKLGLHKINKSSTKGDALRRILGINSIPKVESVAEFDELNNKFSISVDKFFSELASEEPPFGEDNYYVLYMEDSLILWMYEWDYEAYEYLICIKTIKRNP